MRAIRFFWGFLVYFGSWLWPYDEHTTLADVK